jgi:hypothetical protein
MHVTPRLATRLFRLVMVALLGAACSTGGGGRTSAPQPTGSSVPASAGTVRGVVRAVDAQSRTLTVSADAAPQLNLRAGDSQVLAYDASTTVSYQGGTYRPEDLEPGDRIEASVERTGNAWIARRIDVLSSVSAGAGGATLPPGSAPAPGALDATVRWVDARNRTVELEPLSGDRRAIVADYDANTRVEYQGRAYRPEDLERGDVVQIRTRQSGGRLVADQITVTQNARAAAGGAPAPDGRASGDPAAGRAVLRGVISQIDRGSQRIALDSAGWAQGFDERAGAPRGSGTSVVYDDRTIVEYQGKRYGVANLEPGDAVEIDVSRQGNNLRADRIVVTRGA